MYEKHGQYIAAKYMCKIRITPQKKTQEFIGANECQASPPVI